MKYCLSMLASLAICLVNTAVGNEANSETELIAVEQGNAAAIVRGAPMTVEQLAKFGYGPNGRGPSFKDLPSLNEAELHALANQGDSAASHLLWQKLQSDGRLQDAGEVALNQAMLTGETFLVTMMAERYESELDPRATNKWFKLAALLGDPSAPRRTLYLLGDVRLDLDEAKAEADFQAREMFVDLESTRMQRLGVGFSEPTEE